MMFAKITIALLTASLALLATNANAEEGDREPGVETPWMIQLVLESSPDGFDVKETYVVDCEARDWKNSGSGMRVELLNPRDGRTIVGYPMRDPRMVFVEPPEENESKWFNEELVASENVLMFPSAFHVLSFPVVRGEMPELPLMVIATTDSGERLFEAMAEAEHVVPGDVHGCLLPEPIPTTIGTKS